jgi:hypothetical protein
MTFKGCNWFDWYLIFWVVFGLFGFGYAIGDVHGSRRASILDKDNLVYAKYEALKTLDKEYSAKYHLKIQSVIDAWQTGRRAKYERGQR